MVCYKTWFVTRLLSLSFQELSLVAIVLWVLHWFYAETFGKSQSATPTVDVVNMAVDSSDDQQMSDSYRGAGESHGRYVRMPN